MDVFTGVFHRDDVPFSCLVDGVDEAGQRLSLIHISTRRPCQAALGQHMKMQMRHALSAVPATVRHNAVSVSCLLYTSEAAGLRNGFCKVARMQEIHPARQIRVDLSLIHI